MHPAKNARLVHRVKSVNPVRHVKSASRALPLPQKLLQLTKKHCLLMSNCWMTSRMAPKANVHVVAHAVSVVVVTVASVKAMPMAT